MPYLLLSLLLAVPLAGWTAPDNSGSWGCRAKPGGGWDCRWSGKGEPPKPVYQRRKSKKKRSAPVTAKKRPPEPRPVVEEKPAPEAQTATDEQIESTASQPDATTQGADLEMTGLHPYGQGDLTPQPPLPEASDQQQAEPVESSEPPQDKPGFAPINTLKSWFGLSDDNDRKQSGPESVAPTVTADQSPVSSPSENQPAAEAVVGSGAAESQAGEVEPSDPEADQLPGPLAPPPPQTDRVLEAGQAESTFDKTIGGVKRWFGISGTPAPDSKPPSKKSTAPVSHGVEGFSDLQVGAGSSRAAPVQQQLPDPAPAVGNDAGEGSFAPFRALKRWVGFEDQPQQAVAVTKAEITEKSVESQVPRKPQPQRSSAAQTRRPAAVTRPVPSRVKPRKTASTARKIHVIQISSSSQRAGLDALIEQFGLQGKAWVNEERRNAGPWYSLLYGRYDTLHQALDELPTLPASLQQYSPWVRKVEISR